jgi:hypothetical protein
MDKEIPDLDESILEKTGFLKSQTTHHCLSIDTNNCRLAFHGRVVEIFTDKNFSNVLFNYPVPGSLQLYRWKEKKGEIERAMDDCTLICTGMFKKESRIECFIGKIVSLETGTEKRRLKKNMV